MAKSLKDEILDDLIQDIQDVASVEIDDTFKDEFVFSVEDKWYDSYSDFYDKTVLPNMYRRRYNNKGLLDETKMITEVNKTSGKTVEVKFYSDTKTNPYESGEPIYSSLESDKNLIDYLAEEVYPVERRVDLIEETENELDNENKIEKALEIGLKRKGYEEI